MCWLIILPRGQGLSFYSLWEQQVCDQHLGVRKAWHCPSGKKQKRPLGGGTCPCPAAPWEETQGQQGSIGRGRYWWWHPEVRDNQNSDRN